MSSNLLELPRELGDGLVMRRATIADAKALAEFNSRIFEEPAIGDWIQLLLTEKHPLYRASDFFVVVDQNAENKIVSSMGLFSQEWSYAGIPFKVGQPEIVATDTTYRRKGLVRLQFEALHALSAERGELLQAIGGIPWYYRQFGYEMALSLDSWRRFYWPSLPKLGKDETEQYTIASATQSDIPVLKQLYAVHCAGSMVNRLRSDREWQYAITLPEITKADAANHRHYWVIKTLAGDPVGYAEYTHVDKFKRFICREFAVLPGQPLRLVLEFFTRHLYTQGLELGRDQAEPYTGATFMLSDGHPVHEALGNQLERANKSYAWYIRVPDLAAFIKHIAPELEKRLAESVIAGYSGTLKLNFYRKQLGITFEQGKIKDVAPFQPEKMFDSDAFFPELTFLHLLFGHRNLDELGYIYPDCYAGSERAKILLAALFPKLPSQVALLN